MSPRKPKPLPKPNRVFDPINSRQTDVVIPVYDEVGLRQAIAVVASRGGSTERPSASFGATIEIVKPFSVGSPVRIPQACIGLTICATAKFALRARGVVSSLFEVDAAYVTIRDLFVFSASTEDMFTAFVTIPTDAADPDRCAVLDNVVFADRVFVDVDGLGGAALVMGNKHRGVSATFDAPLQSAATEGVCAFNNFEDGGGDAILLGVPGAGPGNGGGRWRLVGNDCDGADITTDESNGGTYLVANANVGTKTLHADDVDVDAAAGGGSSGSSWTTVTKAATETRQSSTGNANDAELKFSMLANTTYRFRARIFVLSDPTPDFTYDVNGPAAPTLVSYCLTHVTTTSFTTFTNDAYAQNRTVTWGADPLRPMLLEIDGIVQNGANAGDLCFRWAQSVSSAIDTSVLKGSYVEYAAL